VKLAISLCYWLLSKLVDLILRPLRKGTPTTCVVLCYHGIPEVHRERFARQMDLLLRWATPVRADFMDTLAVGKHLAAVTFDDGLVSVRDQALPELAKRNIPATLFIPTGYLGKKCTWMRVDQLPLSKRDREQLLHDTVMDSDQLRAICSDRVLLGSHGVRHVHLTSLTEAETKKELHDSKAELENILGQRIQLFSFPRGEYDRHILQWAADAGYKRVFSIEPKFSSGEPFEFLTGRVTVEPTDWNLEFFLKLGGGYHWMQVVAPLKNFLRRIAVRNKERGHRFKG